VKGFRTAARSRMMTAASMLAGLSAALSFVSIPLPVSPVPVTGQSFGAMLSGLALGPLWGAAAMAVYLALGCAGFPVFAGGKAGPGTLFGPTGGYLAGFVLGAWVAGLVVSAGESLLGGQAAGRAMSARGPSGGEQSDAQQDLLRPTPGRRLATSLPLWVYLLAAILGGVVVVHVSGSVWLARYTGRTLGEAFAIGSLPFLPGDVAKALAAALVAGRLRRAVTAPLWNPSR